MAPPLALGRADGLARWPRSSCSRCPRGGALFARRAGRQRTDQRHALHRGRGRKGSPGCPRTPRGWPTRGGGPDDDNWVFRKAVGLGTKPLRLTEHQADDWTPCGRPTGARSPSCASPGGAAIYLVPFAGGRGAQTDRGQRPRLLDGSLLSPSLLVDARRVSPSSLPRRSRPRTSWSAPCFDCRSTRCKPKATHLSSPRVRSATSVPKPSPDGPVSSPSCASSSRSWGQPGCVDPGPAGDGPRRVTNGKFGQAWGLSWTTDASRDRTTAPGPWPAD